MLVSEGLVLALRDGYPVSRGHSLIVPRRHVGSFGEVGLEEQSAMLAMLQRVKALLDEELRPDGYNIGINDGAATGQTRAGGFAGSFRRRPTIGAAGANDRSARRQGPARFPAARSADF